MIIITWPVLQIDVQRIMLGFLAEGHICNYICATLQLGIIICTVRQRLVFNRHAMRCAYSNQDR
jgi:hypothetical protein